MSIDTAHFLACRIRNSHSRQSGTCRPLLVLHAVLGGILLLVAGLGGAGVDGLGDVFKNTKTNHLKDWSKTGLCLLQAHRSFAPFTYDWYAMYNLKGMIQNYR